MRFTIHSTAAQLADVCSAKNVAYGDSVGKSAEMLRLLYPQGIPPERYLDAIIAARIFDKQHRLAQGAEAHGEDPRIDIGGYAVLALHLEKERTTLCPGGASAIPVPVGSPAKALPVSAVNSVSDPTTPSAARTPGQRNSPSLSGCSESTWASASTPQEYVPAQSVQADAKRSVGGPANRAAANLAVALVTFFGFRWLYYTPFFYQPMTVWNMGPVVIFIVCAVALLGFLNPDKPRAQDKPFDEFFDSREDEW